MAGARRTAQPLRCSRRKRYRSLLCPLLHHATFRALHANGAHLLRHCRSQIAGCVHVLILKNVGIHCHRDIALRGDRSMMIALEARTSALNRLGPGR